MRILEVRFKNINSLAGEWVIDLTNPAFIADGIFAITGPTGAGKTTILDAVCLALYGRTPRLERINKNDNEIMSRHTGECYAEITFETRSGRFRTHWSQHRARRKPDGELQNPQHEIVDAVTGKVLESKIRDVALLIEKVTGMDFSRFTRSMLLAQGAFAAFLQAPPDERAPILEQITGTEIYSKISMKVHEKRGEERRKLEDLQAKMAGIQLLSPEEEKELGTVLHEKQIKAAQLNEQVKCWQECLNWMEKINSLNEEIVHLEEEWRLYKDKQQQFMPYGEKLNRSQKALAVEGDYQKIRALRLQQEQENKLLEEAKKVLPDLEIKVQESLKLVQNKKDELAKAKEQLKSETEIIKKVREIDLRLAEKDQEMRNAKNSRLETNKQYSSCQQNITLIKKSLLQTDGTLKEINEYLEEHIVDAGLVENFSAISQLFQLTLEKNTSYKNKCNQLKSAEEARSLLQKSWEQIAATYENSRNQAEKAAKEYQQLVAQIDTLLKGREFNQWCDDLVTLKEQNNLLEQFQASMEFVNTTSENITKMQEQLELLSARQQKINEEINYNMKTQGHYDREIRYLEKEISLLKRIHSLEEERKYLEDGKACPLCGAIEHPYAQGNIPTADETELALKQAREKQRIISDLLLDLKLRLGELNTSIEQTEANIKDLQDIIISEEKKQNEILVRLNIESFLQDPYGKLESIINYSRKQITDYKSIITEAQHKAKIEKITRKNLDEMKSVYANAEKSLQEVTYQQKIAEQEYDRLLKELANAKEELNRCCKRVWQEIAPYGLEETSLKDLHIIINQLRQRRETWQEKHDNKAKQEKNRSDMQLEYSKQETQLIRLEEEIQKNTRELENLLETYSKLLVQRNDLFGEKNPDEVELVLAQKVEQVEKDLETVRKENVRSAQELSNLQVRINSLNDSIHKRIPEIFRGEMELKERLERTCFQNEDDYLAAILGEEEREKLEKEAEQLRKEESELAAKLKDRKSKLNLEQAKKLSNEPYSLIKDNLTTANSQISNLQQEIYAINHSLNENSKKCAELQEHLLEVNLQKKEWERWEILHGLIGSADGKKYRNFAQGLTFEILVTHANYQLQKMNDRYLLLRNSNEPLELNVVDNYQGGQIRSTKNLSGGESFIVSLALALGLSQMASRNVNIDSLFLDEGFGTLDEDVLDSALETLTGLQQEGKMIGIISHVSALKERISSQIEVIPKNGGYSQLKGPGCQQIFG